MEVIRTKVATPGARQGSGLESPEDFRARQLSAQQMLRGDLEGKDLLIFLPDEQEQQRQMKRT